MAEEYLDIVDEDDNVISKDTRDNVHKNFQIHRGIHVLVLNSKGEILIQKRSPNKSYYPGFYDASVGAQVHSGESYEHTARRETQEELGFTPETLTKIYDYKSYSTRQRENRRLFTCRHEGPFDFDHNELESVEFISRTEIQNMIAAGKPFTEGFIISFRHYLESVSYGFQPSWVPTLGSNLQGVTANEPDRRSIHGPVPNLKFWYMGFTSPVKGSQKVLLRSE